MKKLFGKFDHYILATAFIFGFMGFFAVFPIQFDFIDPVAEAIGDFDITDYVFSSEDFRDQNPKVDSAVLMVDTGDLDRRGIAQLLKIIYKYHPRVIGIDHFFRKLKYGNEDTAKADDDVILATTLREATMPVVLATKASKPNNDETAFDSLETSNPFFLGNTLGGCANVTSDVGSDFGANAYKTCRSFMPSFEVNGKTELAFAVKLAQLYNPKATAEFLERNNVSEDINFRRRIGNYAGLSINQVLNEQFTEEMVKDKIVILGTLKNFYNFYDIEDMFFTPMNKTYVGKSRPDMNGPVIHANIISMILARDYINHVPDWLANLLGVLVCFLNVIAFRAIMDGKYGHWYDALSKVIQIAESIVIMFVLVYLFAEYKLKINLTLMLGAVALVGDLLEIYEDVLRRFWEDRSKIWEKIKKAVRFGKPAERFNS